eukprot:TRINITY_DN18505_c0_g1_i1.p1 TRINITY_DN18505_c0_g1~~TRINITY_DN18505_c0_g1_i1.p1  ORF type:complete len:259 (-),score=67.15 TRINITY_DN18505_c0_g1_i1:131-886(-)
MSAVISKTQLLQQDESLSDSDTGDNIQEPAKKKRRTITEADKIYKCEEPGCGKSYASKSGLSTHLKTHKEGGEAKLTPKKQKAAQEELQRKEAEAKARAERRAVWENLAKTNLNALLDQIELLDAEARIHRVSVVQAQENAASAAEALRASVLKSFNTLMVYTNSSLKNHKKKIAVDFPNVTPQTFKELFKEVVKIPGPGHKFSLNEDDFLEVFGKAPSKSLRYSIITPDYPIKVLWDAHCNLRFSTQYGL